VQSFESLKEVIHHINDVKMQQDNLHRLQEIETTIAGFKVYIKKKRLFNFRKGKFANSWTNFVERRSFAEN
jgi:hypothetical protein